MVEKLIGRFCGDVRFSIKVKLRLLQFFTEKFQCLFVYIYFYLSSVGELLLQKTALVRMIKKDDHSVKNKSSNVTESNGEMLFTIPFISFLCPMSKKKVEERSSY